MLATQPFSKRMRALAMSSRRLNTGTPTASIDLDRRPNEMQNDFEIVNHEIEDDADIGAAIGKRREPMRLDETRMSESCLERAEHGIETLDVADLQDEAPCRGQFRKRYSLASCRRQLAFRSADAFPFSKSVRPISKCETVGVATDAASTRLGKFLDRSQRSARHGLRGDRLRVFRHRCRRSQ